MNKLVIILMGLFLVGCQVTYKPIQQKHATRFGQLKLGATLEEVRTVFPEIYSAGQNVDDNGAQVEVYELRESEYVLSKDRFVEQQIWFYFKDGKLSRWGRPQDWRKKEPNVIIQDNR